MGQAELIAGDEALRDVATRLATADRIAFDTEAASFHRYIDRVYLIQISTIAETVLIDPLEVTNLQPVGYLLENPNIEVVFHDADYDLRVLHRDYGFHPRHLFDTRLAAQLAGEESVGLSALLEKYVGVKLDKRFQRADWSQRPLTPEMITYAANDTRYLLRLRDILAKRLRELSRMDWAQEEFARLERVKWKPASSDEAGYLRIKGAKALQPRQRAVLQHLFAWRDMTARTLDRSPFRVLGNATLISIAKALPASQRALSDVSGISTAIARRYGSQIMAAVESGMATPREDLPKVKRHRRPLPDAGYEARLEQLKALRDARSKSYALDPGLVCPNGTLQAIARAAPSSLIELREIRELRSWQRDVLGEAALLEAVGTG